MNIFNEILPASYYPIINVGVPVIGYAYRGIEGFAYAYLYYLLISSATLNKPNTNSITTHLSFYKDEGYLRNLSINVSHSLKDFLYRPVKYKTNKLSHFQVLVEELKFILNYNKYEVLEQKELSTLDIKLSNRVFFRGFSAILGNLLSFANDEITGPVIDSHTPHLIMSEFMALLNVKYLTYAPVNLSSYKGSIGTLKAMAETIKYYYKAIKREQILEKTLICGSESILEYFKYGVNQLMPNTYFEFIDILPKQSGFFDTINQALKAKLLRELDQPNISDFYRLGRIPFFLRIIYNGVNSTDRLLGIRGKEFNCISLKGYTKREINKEHQNIEQFYQTNSILPKLESPHEEIAVIGYTETLSLDEAVISRFTHYIEEERNFEDFLNYCKALYLECKLEFNEPIFANSKIDTAIYNIAVKLSSSKRRYETAYHMIPRICEFSIKYPQLSLDRFLRFI